VATEGSATTAVAVTAGTGVALGVVVAVVATVVGAAGTVVVVVLVAAGTGATPSTPVAAGAVTAVDPDPRASTTPAWTVGAVRWALTAFDALPGMITKAPATRTPATTRAIHRPR
jgi:hypothetical protein